MPQLILDSITRRLDALRAEYQTGLEQKRSLQKRLEELDATLLRISGAIQVLEETVSEAKTETA